MDAISNPVTVHYYVGARSHVGAFLTVLDARPYLRRAYEESELTAIAVRARITAEHLSTDAPHSWVEALDRALGRPVSIFAMRPVSKCVIAGYRAGERTQTRAFFTAADARQFLDQSSTFDERKAWLFAAHITTHDARDIVSQALHQPIGRVMPHTWECALDSVLSGRPQQALVCDTITDSHRRAAA